MTKYDLAIVYRIYPKVSKIPPIYSDDKYKLSELCLKSFSDSVRKIKPKIWVLLDNCPQEYFELFNKHLSGLDYELLDLPFTGNAGTFTKQAEILLNQTDSDLVFFAEDDYFYLDDAFEKMVRAFNHKQIDFLAPYDHDDSYHLKLHNYKNDIILAGNHHWRTTGSTTMTFMTSKDVLRQTWDIFSTYSKNNYDASIWLSLTGKSIKNPFKFLDFLVNDKIMRNIYLKAWYFGLFQILFGKKYRLFTPIKSLANHMDSLHLAPNIDWNAEFDKVIKSLR